MKKNGMSERGVPLPMCTGKLEVPTEKEREALEAMRSIKERVRALKKRLSTLKSSYGGEHGEEALELQEQIASLKRDWDMWEEKRRKAAKERMILLGHEKGP